MSTARNAAPTGRCHVPRRPQAASPASTICRARAGSRTVTDPLRPKAPVPVRDIHRRAPLCTRGRFTKKRTDAAQDRVHFPRLSLAQRTPLVEHIQKEVVIAARTPPIPLSRPERAVAMQALQRRSTDPLRGQRQTSGTTDLLLQLNNVCEIPELVAHRRHVESVNANRSNRVQLCAVAMIVNREQVTQTRVRADAGVHGFSGVLNANHLPLMPRLVPPTAIRATENSRDERIFGTCPAHSSSHSMQSRPHLGSPAQVQPCRGWPHEHRGRSSRISRHSAPGSVPGAWFRVLTPAPAR